MTPEGPTVTGYVDANILVAFLAGPEHVAFPIARSVIERVRTRRLRLIVTPIVAAEVLWLARKVLGVGPAEAAERLSELTRMPGFQTTETPVLERALDLVVKRPRLDFADAWITARALTVGPAVVVSLGRDLDGIEGLERIGA